MVEAESHAGLWSLRWVTSIHLQCLQKVLIIVVFGSCIQFVSENIFFCFSVFTFLFELGLLCFHKWQITYIFNWKKKKKLFYDALIICCPKYVIFFSYCLSSVLLFKFSWKAIKGCCLMASFIVTTYVTFGACCHKRLSSVSWEWKKIIKQNKMKWNNIIKYYPEKYLLE